MSQTPVNDYLLNQIVKSAEVNAILQRSRELGGLALAALVGSETGSVNATAPHSLVAVATGGLVVRVGDTTVPPLQFALLAGIMADYCPATNLTAVAGTGTPRYDYVAVKAALFTADTFTTQFINPLTRVVTDAPATDTKDSFASQIFEGDGTPNHPGDFLTAGWIALAQIQVVNTTASNVTAILPTIAQAISAIIPGAPVLSVNGQTGNVVIESTDSSITVSPGGSNIDLSVNFPTPPVISVNGSTGAVTVTLTTLNGVGPGAVVLTSTDSSIVITPGAGTVDLSAVPPGIVPIGGVIHAFQNTPTGLSLVLPGGATVRYSLRCSSEVNTPGSGTVSTGMNGSSTDAPGTGANGGTTGITTSGGAALTMLHGGTGKGGDTIILFETWSGGGGLTDHYQDILAIRTA